jgi:hypothetical protein
VELGRWQSVETFIRTERPLRLRNPDPDFFVQRQLKFLHDAYELAKFAARIGADQVRLADRRDQWPDGFVRISKRTIKVEVTRACCFLPESGFPVRRISDSNSMLELGASMDDATLFGRYSRTGTGTG